MKIVREFFLGREKRAVFWVLLTCFLLIAWKYFGSQAFYRSHIASTEILPFDSDLGGAVYLFASTTLMMAVIPVVVMRFGFKQGLAEAGVRLGELSKAAKPFVVLLPIMILLTIPSSRQADFRAEYPYWSQAGASLSAFAIYSLSYLFFYYVPWEFFFRGVLQTSLKSVTGPTIAILFQTLASTLVHIGKPANETFGAILGGLLWGWIAEETGSILLPILMHWILGSSLDAFILFMR